tara:strand:- start:2133 stop:2639 length:507 start_codon:yes stop_codon:yes gene_type:complete
MKFEFEHLRDAMGDPKEKLEIVKTLVEDGATLTVGLASFGFMWLGPDPDNNDLPTMWYTKPTKILGEDDPTMEVRLRKFLTGQVVVPKLHHHVASYWDDGLLWHVYLDRTEAHETERREMGEALREVTQDIAQFVRDHVDAQDEDVEPDDFINKLLEDINNHLEEGNS